MWPITSVLVQVAPRESRKAFLLLYRKGSVGFPSNCILRGGWDLPDLWEVRYLIVFMLFRSFLCFTDTLHLSVTKRSLGGGGGGVRRPVLSKLGAAALLLGTQFTPIPSRPLIRGSLTGSPHCGGTSSHADRAQWRTSPPQAGRHACAVTRTRLDPRLHYASVLRGSSVVSKCDRLCLGEPVVLRILFSNTSQKFQPPDSRVARCRVSILRNPFAL